MQKLILQTHKKDTESFKQQDLKNSAEFTLYYLNSLAPITSTTGDIANIIKTFHLINTNYVIDFLNTKELNEKKFLMRLRYVVTSQSKELISLLELIIKN